ncbi:THUMP domain-containing protein [Halorubellus sp. PRR65]|uniref:THUMP domain-containing protein n=1 Tax=Halorubellus sp. PRR65 TaxID=3098148 RepID=UPI002B257664|nr:THUMP domain-containing protein [Halorubellus sp. PRR65]
MYLLELGGEDDAFARREAATAATGVSRLGVGLATADAVVPERVRGLAYTRRASELVGTGDASIPSARALLDAAPLAREGSVAVRARDVRGGTGVSTSDAERELGGVLVDRGFDVDLDDPDHVLRVAFAPETDPEGEGEPAEDAPAGRQRGDAGVCAVGWETAASVRDFGDRRPTDRPFFQPGSMDPLLARAIANLAGARPGATVLDPMCGTGGVLVEAGLVGADVLGVDAQAKMAAGARENLAAFLDDDGERGAADDAGRPTPGDWATMRGDATRLALRDDAVSGVVFDAPYGRQSKIETHGLDDLVAGALAESRRVADRCVLVADRDWRDAALDAGWTVDAAFQRRVHASLDRYVLVLDDDDVDARAV